MCVKYTCSKSSVVSILFIHHISSSEIRYSLNRNGYKSRQSSFVHNEVDDT